VGLIYALALSLVFASPSALSLWPATYPGISAARLVAFLAGVLILVAYGRYLRRHHLPRLLRGLLVGAVSAFLGTLLYQYVIRLPMAQSTLIQILPGVPARAALILLHLHQRTGSLLSALVSAGLNAIIGAVATGWAGLPPRSGESTGDTANNTQASES